MTQFLSIGLVVVVGGLFGRFVPISKLYDGFSPMTVALSIMAAAVLVRLNRGLPTIDWKLLDAAERRRLSKSLLRITGEYLFILALLTFLLGTFVCLTVVGKDAVNALDSCSLLARIGSMLIGGLVCLAVLRMAYVVWRDYDIVRLQTHLLDLAATKDERDQERAAAESRVSEMLGNRVATPSSPAPAEWGN